MKRMVLSVLAGTLTAINPTFTFSIIASYGTYTINNVRQLRADFGSYLLLGLEFLIASDILKTVVDPTLDELAILGGVVIVRTVLSVFLNKEIKELAEEENSKST